MMRAGATRPHWGRCFVKAMLLRVIEAEDNATVLRRTARDRSIAIAHGLEELYEERGTPERPACGRRKRAG